MNSTQVRRRDSADLLLRVQHSPVTLQLAHVSSILCGFDVNVFKKEKNIGKRFFNVQQNLVSLVILLHWGGTLPFLVRMKSKTARSL